MVLSPGNVTPQGTLAMSEDIFPCCNWMGAESPGLPLHKVQDSPPPQRVVLPQMSLVLRLRTPGPEKTEVCSSSWGQGRPLERDI